MATMNISLPEPMKAWVESRSHGGAYANSSDYVRDLIRRDQARMAVIADGQAALDVGLASGTPALLDVAAFLAERRASRG